MRILIADDVSFVRRSLKTMIQQIGHEVVGEAENGKQAVELFGVLQPDLVILDLAMPIMNGIEATKSIIKMDPGARILILSGLTQENLATEAMLAGAQDFITKPVLTSEFATAIEQMNQNQVRRINYA